jgi:type I restriction enzyme S subunit
VPVIKEITLTLPPLPEQQAIAEVLSSLDDKIDLLHRNNKTLEEMAETLFRQWFVSEDEGSWTTVGEEFNIIMGQSPPGHTYNEDQHGIPFYQGRTDFNLRFPKRRVYCTEPTRLAKKFDTLLSVRAPVGDVNISTESCCIGRGLAAISHKNPEVHYSYTYMLFNFIKSSFDVHEQSGTVFGSISKNELHALKCPKLINPDLFTEKISLLQNKITENSIQIDSLGELRDTLLPKLMSGQVRVKIDK